MNETIDQKRTLSNLLELAAEAIEIDRMLTDLDGDISDPCVAEAVDKWLAKIAEDVDVVADQVTSLVREKELRIAMLSAELDRIKLKMECENRGVTFIKDKLKMALEAMNLKKAGKIRTATVCANGGKTPLSIDLAPEDMPDGFRKEKIVCSYDDEAIRNSLDRGDQLAFARYEARGTHLRIK